MTLPGAAMWDERYVGPDYAYGLEPNVFLAAQTSERVGGKKAVVPGDGEGRNGVWLACQGYEVDSLDLSEHGVAKSLSLAKARGVAVNALCADALAWDWPRAHYDLVALIYLHLPTSQRKLVHALALASLKPGGRIVLEAFRPEQIERQKAGARGGPRDVGLLYRAEDLRGDFGVDAEIFEAEAALREGALHMGQGAVVRVLARAK